MNYVVFVDLLAVVNLFVIFLGSMEKSLLFVFGEKLLSSVDQIKQSTLFSPMVSRLLYVKMQTTGLEVIGLNKISIFST